MGFDVVIIAISIGLALGVSIGTLLGTIMKNEEFDERLKKLENEKAN